MKKQLRNLNGVSKSDTKTIKLNQRKMLPDIDRVEPPGDSIISISSTTVEPYEEKKKTVFRYNWDQTNHQTDSTDRFGPVFTTLVNTHNKETSKFVLFFPIATKLVAICLLMTRRNYFSHLK